MQQLTPCRGCESVTHRLRMCSDGRCVKLKGNDWCYVKILNRLSMGWAGHFHCHKSMYQKTGDQSTETVNPKTDGLGLPASYMMTLPIIQLILLWLMKIQSCLISYLKIACTNFEMVTLGICVSWNYSCSGDKQVTSIVCYSLPGLCFGHSFWMKTKMEGFILSTKHARVTIETAVLPCKNSASVCGSHTKFHP